MKPGEKSFFLQCLSFSTLFKVNIISVGRGKIFKRPRSIFPEKAMKDEFGGNKLISCTRGKAFQKWWQSKTISKGIGAEKHEDTEKCRDKIDQSTSLA